MEKASPLQNFSTWLNHNLYLQHGFDACLVKFILQFLKTRAKMPSFLWAVRCFVKCVQNEKISKTAHASFIFFLNLKREMSKRKFADDEEIASDSEIESK